jgi:hypothetical protein
MDDIQKILKDARKINYDLKSLNRKINTDSIDIDECCVIVKHITERLQEVKNSYEVEHFLIFGPGGQDPNNL